MYYSHFYQGTALLEEKKLKFIFASFLKAEVTGPTVPIVIVDIIKSVSLK